MGRAVVGAAAISVMAIFSAHAQSFSCPIGTRASCLGYNDKVVDSRAQCFDQFTCFPGGFICKSDAEEMQDKARGMIQGYDQLRNCIVRAADMDDVAACIQRDNMRAY